MFFLFRWFLLLVCAFWMSIPLFAQGKAKIKMAALTLKIFPVEHELLVGGQTPKRIKTAENTYKIYLEAKEQELLFKASGYLPKTMKIQLNKNLFIEDKLEKDTKYFTQINQIKSGIQPKSVEFTPDGKYFLSALLLDKGIDVFSPALGTKLKTLELPLKYQRQKGFVEIAFVKRLQEIWVSQMTTGMVHIFSLADFSYKESFSVKGTWSKVITIDHAEKTAYVSNWLSKNISVIDIEKRQVLAKIATPGIPRGMVITPDDKYLYACIFQGDGRIQKIDLATRKIVKALETPSGVKRHIVQDPKRGLFYVSDMKRGSIMVINAADDKLLKEVNVAKNLNTIKLSADGRHLFISSRGPNGSNFLYKGPEFGKIFVLETENMKILEWFWGKNQPTGLDVSPDGRYLAFSNFLDTMIEVYRVNL